MKEAIELMALFFTHSSAPPAPPTNGPLLLRCFRRSGLIDHGPAGDLHCHSLPLLPSGADGPMVDTPPLLQLNNVPWASSCHEKKGEREV